MNPISDRYFRLELCELFILLLLNTLKPDVAAGWLVVVAHYIINFILFFFHMLLHLGLGHKVKGCKFLKVL